MSFTPISETAIKRCVEALIEKHDYDPDETGDFNNESLSKLIGQIQALGYIAPDVETITLYELDKDDNTLEYIEVRVQFGGFVATNAEHLDPYDYTAEYDFESFGYLVENVINDVNQRAERTREALAAYKKEG